MSDLFAMLLATVLKSSLLLLVAALITLCLRRGSAATRHLVWSAAFAGALVLPILTAVLPRLDVQVVTRPALLAASGAGATAGGAGASGSFDWKLWLLIAWGVGALLLVARLVVGLSRVRALAARATVVADARALALLGQLSDRLSIRREVRLLRGEAGAIPMTWGVLRPVVYLPAESGSWSDERLEAVLAHELAHVVRRDTLTRWIAQLAIGLYWFNPLVWLAARGLYEEAERACDDAVLRLGTAAWRYADHLVALVRTFAAREPLAAATGMGGQGRLEQRVSAILDASAARQPVGRGSALSAGLACVGPVLLLAALHLEAATPAVDPTLSPSTASAPAASAPREEVESTAPQRIAASPVSQDSSEPTRQPTAVETLPEEVGMSAPPARESSSSNSDSDSNSTLVRNSNSNSNRSSNDPGESAGAQASAAASGN